MRILQLCNKPPFPPIDGGSKAMHNITRGLLAAGHSVKVICLSTPKHPLVPDDVPEPFRKATGIEGVFVDTSINVVDAFTDLLTAENYNVSRFFSPDLDIRLIRLLSQETFDIVQLESLFMTPYIPNIRRYSRAPIVLRSHNLEHVLQERIASGERHFLKKPYRKYLAKQLKTYELEMLDRVDGVAAITPSDAEHYRAHGTRTPITTVPFGVDPAEYEADLPGGDPVFFHLGSMDWLPNEEGVRWLLKEVWPRVLRTHPKAKLQLAGNKMPKDLLDTDLPGVTVQGRVKSANAYMAARHVMVVPLFSAGGMRVKIVEGMAMGRCVISTHMGAEGIDHTDGTDILLADTPAAFAAHITALLDEPARVARIGQAARRLIDERYSDKPIIDGLVAFYRTLLKA
ncbi:MAG: glycosyltransferase [Flavobacteriales bacterium]|nr:glycosyltransferase [Flavobacteriales bacterium]